MPIYGLSDTIVEDIIVKEDTSIVPHFESDRVDDVILSTLPGIEWPVTYFNRNISVTNSVTTYDPEIDITLQEYNRYNELIIHVEEALPNGIPDNLTGRGIIDINIVPTPNDVFLTKLPDGRVGIFTITSVLRMNYNNKHLYKVEYILYMAVSDTTDPTYVSLLSAVDSEFYYNKDFRLEQDKDIIKKDEYVIREKYLRRIDKLVRYWSSRFISTNTNYLIGYTDNDKNIFDPFMEKFVKNTIGIDNLSIDLELSNIEFNDISILDFITNSDYLASRLVPYVIYTSKSTYGINPYQFPILYNMVITDVVTLSNNTEAITEDATIDEVYPYVDSKYYIFRKRVYDIIQDLPPVDDDEDRALTVFEKLLLDMLTANVMDINDIDRVYEKVYKLPDVESFYFTPVLIYMIRYYLTTFTVRFT